MAGVHSQKHLKMQCSRARFVSGGSRVLHYRSSGWCLKNKVPCAHFLTRYPDHRGGDCPLRGTSRAVPAAPAASGLFGALCARMAFSWQAMFSVTHFQRELPLVCLTVSHRLQILCLNLIRNFWSTEKWRSLNFSNGPGKWRTLPLFY